MPLLTGLEVRVVRGAEGAGCEIQLGVVNIPMGLKGR